VAESFGTLAKNLPLLELARLLVRLVQVSGCVVNMNHGIT
jgi:hypothetical protein